MCREYNRRAVQYIMCFQYRLYYLMYSSAGVLWLTVPILYSIILQPPQVRLFRILLEPFPHSMRLFGVTAQPPTRIFRNQSPAVHLHSDAILSILFYLSVFLSNWSDFMCPGSKMKSNNARYEDFPATSDLYCGDKCFINRGMEKVPQSFEIGTIDSTNIMSPLLSDLS